MATQAVEQLKSLREWSLDDYVANLIAKLGWERYPALWEMWDRIANRLLLFFRQRLVDGKPYSPWDHETIHGTPKPFNKELVDADRFRSNYEFDFDDHDRVKVVSPREWSVYRYTVAEPPQPPASQAAPDQQSEAPQELLTSKEWLKREVERRIKLDDIPKEITEFSKQIHPEMEKAVRAGCVNRVVKPRTIEGYVRATTNLFPKKKRSRKSQKNRR